MSYVLYKEKVLSSSFPKLKSIIFFFNFLAYHNMKIAVENFEISFWKLGT